MEFLNASSFSSRSATSPAVLFITYCWPSGSRRCYRGVYCFLGFCGLSLGGLHVFLQYLEIRHHCLP